MISIGHIINPVNVGFESDLFKAQPITFSSMLNAKNYSENPENINQLIIGFDEDMDVFPKGFEQLPSLKRSVFGCWFLCENEEIAINT